MDPRIAQAVEALKQCKSQQLSFYAAQQALKSQGFSDEQIRQAADQFEYASTPQGLARTPVAVPTQGVPEVSLERMGNAVLQDRERTGRTYAYAAALPVGFYLGINVFASVASKDSRPCWSPQGIRVQCIAHNGVLLTILLGLAGIALLLGGLKIVFWYRDHRYRQIDKALAEKEPK